MKYCVFKTISNKHHLFPSLRNGKRLRVISENTYDHDGPTT